MSDPLQSPGAYKPPVLLQPDRDLYDRLTRFALAEGHASLAEAALRLLDDALPD